MPERTIRVLRTTLIYVNYQLFDYQSYEQYSVFCQGWIESERGVWELGHVVNLEGRVSWR